MMSNVHAGRPLAMDTEASGASRRACPGAHRALTPQLPDPMLAAGRGHNYVLVGLGRDHAARQGWHAVL